MEFEIIIDNREIKLKDILKNEKGIVFENLDLGDILIKIKGKSQLLIERKTNNDLSASIIDGRYKEQKHRMKNLNIDILYILEGESPLLNDDLKLDKSLKSIELNLIFNKKINMIRTKNVNETANIILKLLSYYLSKKTDIIENISKESEAIDLLCLKKNKCINKTNICKIMLCQIPNISVNIANTLSKEFNNSISELINFLKTDLSIDYISNLKINKNKIGKKRAEHIKSYLI